LRKKKLSMLNPCVAGIDIGAYAHFIAIPAHLDDKPVREVGAFTCDLKEAAAWLKRKGITSVAMESTGVYWTPFFEILEDAGLEVILVQSRQIKHVPGRKSDVLDCQWIQQLHAYGLLKGSFRVDASFALLRSLVRQRTLLIQEQTTIKARMQKCLDQMNLKLTMLISDITGDMGLNIMRDIAKGIHDPKHLAAHHTARYKSTKEEIEKSLEGHYRPEHIFALKQNLDAYDFYQDKIAECDAQIETTLHHMHGVHQDMVGADGVSMQEAAPRKKKLRKTRKNELRFDACAALKAVTGVDLTEIDGMNENTVLKVLAETGTNMDRWHNEKHFASWLGLAPGTKISGGKKLSTRTRSCKNRAADALRIAAYTLMRNQSALGAFLRRKKAQFGAPKAITATAHKIAKIFYMMLKHKTPYKDLGAHCYEARYKERLVHTLKKRAESLGFVLAKAEGV